MWGYCIAALTIVVANAVLYFWNPHLSAIAGATVAAVDVAGVLLVFKAGAELVKLGAEIKKLQFEARQRDSLVTIPDPKQTLRIAEGAKSWQQSEESKRRFGKNLFLPIVAALSASFGTYFVGRLISPTGVAAVDLKVPEVSNLILPEYAAKSEIKSKFEYEARISNSGPKTAVNVIFSIEAPPYVTLGEPTFDSPNGNILLMEPSESGMPDKPNGRILRVRMLRPGETLTIRYSGASNRYFQTSGLRVGTVELSPFGS